MITTELRLEQYVMPAADLGPENPLGPFRNPAPTQDLPGNVDPSIDPEVVRNMAYRDYDGCLPYTLQSNYGCQRTPRSFQAAVLENELLRATFLLELGGRMWSLIHKPTGRELL